MGKIVTWALAHFWGLCHRLQVLGYKGYQRPGVFPGFQHLVKILVSDTMSLSIVNEYSASC